eukprot:gene10396-11480_t
MAHYEPDILCITEVLPKHTSTKPQESEFEVDGFDICSNIDQGKRGVMIYTAKHLKASPANLPNVDFEECCWVEIHLDGKDKLLVGCLYRSPNCDVANTAKLYSNLKQISDMKIFSHILLCGDFKFPEIDWSRDLAPDDSLGFQFKECIRDSFLTQHVHQYTHRRGDQRPSTIDLMLTNEENMIDRVAIEHHSERATMEYFVLPSSVTCRLKSTNPPNHCSEKEIMSNLERK